MTSATDHAFCEYCAINCRPLVWEPHDMCAYVNKIHVDGPRIDVDIYDEDGRHIGRMSRSSVEMCGRNEVARNPGIASPDKVQEAYDAGFANGVKATLQQLDGLISSGYDLKNVVAWIDRQWEEGSAWVSEMATFT